MCCENSNLRGTPYGGANMNPARYQQLAQNQKLAGGQRIDPTAVNSSYNNWKTQQNTPAQPPGPNTWSFLIGGPQVGQPIPMPQQTIPGPAPNTPPAATPAFTPSPTAQYPNAALVNTKEGQMWRPQGLVLPRSGTGLAGMRRTGASTPIYTQPSGSGIPPLAT